MKAELPGPLLHTALLLVSFAPHLRAAAPVLEHLYPAGGQAGFTHAVTATGKFEPWPPQVWVSPPGLEFNAETNQGRLNVTIAPEAEPGPRLVRFFNDEGVSEPRLFVVGSGPEINDQEPNDHFARPQRIDALPVTINGRLDKRGDVDSFAIILRAGEWLDARVDAYTLMSRMDAVLRLMTEQGRQLAWNHDFATLDPRLVWQAEEDQTVVAQIFGFAYPADAQVRLTGGDSCIYRLHLSASETPPDDHPLAGKGASAPFSAEETITLPFRIAAAFDEGRETHAYRFAAKAGEVIEASVEAAVHGWPLDAWLSIHDPEGKQLVRNDDTDDSRDPRQEWAVPSDGEYMIKVGSVTHRGGPEFRYVLNIQQVFPDFKARLASSSVVISADSTQEVKVAMTRLRGFTNELTLTWRGLPEGVSGAAVVAPEKNGDAVLVLVAQEDAAGFSGPVQIESAAGGTTRLVSFELTGASIDNGVPGGFRKLLKESSDQFWLTVRPREPAAEAAASAIATEAPAAGAAVVAR